MDEKAIDFLYNYLNNASPTGFEAAGQKIWMEYMRPYVDEFITDTYGNVVGVVNPGTDYKVVVEAHADEISWFVSYVNPEGFIYVKRNGGSDHMIAPSKRVRIFGDHGIVRGVFGWPAIHTRSKPSEESPKLNNIFIDVGAASDKEVFEMGIHAGCVIVFDDEFELLNGIYYTGRALDNRIGGFMAAQVARRMFEEGKRPDYTLYFVNSVQEEVGLRGAQMIAHTLQADLAIVTDVTHDSSTPMVDKIENGDIRCGRGPVLMVGPAVHNMLLADIAQLAKKEAIDFQYDSASRSTGTDTDAFAYANGGTTSALISLPLRYMHTTVEMCHVSDVEAVIELIYAFLLQHPKGKRYNYLD